MPQKITKATDAQWAEIAALRESVIAGLTDQPSEESVREVVRSMWLRMGKKPRAVLVADCPIVGALFFCWLSRAGDQLRNQLHDQLRNQLHYQLRDQLDGQLGGQLRNQLDGQLHGQLRNQLDGQLHGQLRNQLRNQLDGQLRNQLDGQLGGQLRNQRYWSIWWRAWSAWCEGAKILGVNFDLEKYETFRTWTTHVPFVYANAAIPIVSRWPAAVHWKNKRLHNEHGKAVEFRSGWGLWVIDGLPVNEQIVMRPETQTVNQIDAEKNQDVRSIRIQRFGWTRYIKESGAVSRDERRNEIEGTLEALFLCKDGSQRLVVTCPTGRPFSLGVPSEVSTCKQAQFWLSSGRSKNVIAAT